MIRPTDSADCSVREFFESVYVPARLPLGSDRTTDHYHYALRKFASAVGHEPLLSDLSDRNLMLMVRAMRADGIAVATINRGPLSRILALWRFAARRGLVTTWPEISRLNEPQIVPESWTVAQVQQLLDGCARMPGRVGTHEAGDWWRAFNLVAFYTGERTGAILRIPYDGLNLAARTLVVPATCRKGRTKPAVYRDLPDVVVEALRAIESPRRPKLFAWPLCESRFYAAYTRLLQLAGLPSGRRHKPQKLRRTFATLLEAAGGDATKALMHSDRRVTERSYLDPTQATGPAPASLLPRVGEKKS